MSLLNLRTFIEVFQLAQLSEVLNGSNHLAGVGVLVVVPGNNLNLVQVIRDLANHGLGCVEQGAVLHADYVGGNDGILVVAVGLGSGSLHNGVDLFLGNAGLLNNSG